MLRSTLLITAATVVVLAVVPPATASGHGHRHGPLTAAARDAGLTTTNGGEMGWREKATARPAKAPATSLAASVEGIDVSRYQGTVDWASYWSQGKRFAYVKATEGTYYTSPTFSQQYDGSYALGFIRGSYHFANPSDSGGAAQATYFVQHGGGWSADGKTLPGVLDIEYNPYAGGTCYGLSHAQMVTWISDFTATYRYLTRRDAVIYTSTDWWTTCTGDSAAFAASNPLWIARYGSSVGTLPTGWGFHTFWQYTSSPLDQDLFNGSLDRLIALATG